MYTYLLLLAVPVAVAGLWLVVGGQLLLLLAPATVAGQQVPVEVVLLHLAGCQVWLQEQQDGKR